MTLEEHGRGRIRHARVSLSLSRPRTESTSRDGRYLLKFISVVPVEELLEHRRSKHVHRRRPPRSDSRFVLDSRHRQQLGAARGSQRLSPAEAVAPVEKLDHNTRRDDAAIREVVVEGEGGPCFGIRKNVARRRKTVARGARRFFSPC